ncbi:MAG: hypothetical protein ACRC0V_08430, partial [Fusobacteriaceae bacterium]
MGRNVKRITKQRWYEIDGKQHELHRVEDVNDAKRYYYVDNNAIKWVDNQLLKQKYIVRLGDNNFFNKKLIFKPIKGFKKNQGEYIKQKLDENEIVLYRILNKKDEKDSRKQYIKNGVPVNTKRTKDGDEIKYVLDNNDKNPYLIYQMKEQERNLTNHRIAAVKNINEKYRQIMEEIVWNDDFTIALDQKKIKELATIVLKYNINKEKVGQGKIDLIDENSKYSFQTYESARDIWGIINELLNSKISEEEFSSQFIIKVEKKNKMLNNSLGVKTIQGRNTDKLKYVKFEEAKFLEAINLYGLYPLIEKIQTAEYNSQKVDPMNVELFKTIKDHYASSNYPQEKLTQEMCYY